MNGRRTFVVLQSCRGAKVGGRKSMQLFNMSDSSGLDYRGKTRALEIFTCLSFA